MSARRDERSAPEYRYVHCARRPPERGHRPARERARAKRALIGQSARHASASSTLLDLGVGDEADLASYLLFDGQFCRQLIEMGRADAQARRDELLAFFGDAADDAGGGPTDEELGASGTWERRSFPIGT